VADHTPCSVLNAQLPLAGSAPTSESWLIVVHQGAWGERPVDTLISQDLQLWANDHGAQILIGRTPKDIDPYPNSTFLYSDNRGNLFQGILDSEGLPDLTNAHRSKPMLLICTNGKRDQCCATYGRSLITQCKEVLSPDLYRQILECSHLGGHRFAPTAIWLPENLVLGRLEPDAVSDLIEHGVIDSRFIRGNTKLSPAQQVVHAFVWPQEIEFQSCEQHDTEFHITALMNNISESFLVNSTTGYIVASCGGDPKPNTWYHMRMDI
jgi:hypothetical protein